MATKTTKICDLCKQPIERVVVKLWIKPVKDAHYNRRGANEYTGHADIGECCALKVANMFKWNRRQKRSLNGSSRNAVEPTIKDTTVAEARTTKRAGPGKQPSAG